MKKKLFIIIFMGLLLVPFVGMRFYKADLSIEKKHDEALPQPVTDGKVNLQFFQELTDYMADHFAFRQELITADAGVKADLFQSSANEKVIVGKDGWLFFEETLDDYMKRNCLNKRQIHNCARVLKLIEQGVEVCDADFVFVAAPNKNTLYGEYMPDRYVPLNGQGNLNALITSMKEQGVHYVDLREVLSEQKEQVYHKLDTHWNNLGASIACENILDALGKKHTSYEKEAYTRKKSFDGDLQGMLFPKSSKKDWNVIYSKKQDYRYTNKVVSTEQMEIRTENKSVDSSAGGKKTKHRNILMYRDSFGNALVPFVAQEYKKGFFTKEVPYDLSLLSQSKADDVVIELAQRQIPTLLEGVPYMMAPGVSFDKDVEEVKGTTATMETEKQDGVLRVSGQTDPRFTDDDSPVYISFYGEKNLLMFEAFPSVYDPMDEKADRSYSYGAYIDISSMPSDDYRLEIITKKDRNYYTTGFLGEYVIK